MSLFNKLFAVAVSIMILATVEPEAAFAQGVGLGSDGFTRQLWTLGTDWRVSLWKLDGALNVVSTVQYGPFGQWEPLGLAVNQPNNNSYVLWRNTNGSISVWIVDPNLNFVTSQVYGPFNGWVPKRDRLGSRWPADILALLRWNDIYLEPGWQQFSLDQFEGVWAVLRVCARRVAVLLIGGITLLAEEGAMNPQYKKLFVFATAAAVASALIASASAQNSSGADVQADSAAFGNKYAEMPNSATQLSGKCKGQRGNGKRTCAYITLRRDRQHRRQHRLGADGHSRRRLRRNAELAGPRLHHRKCQGRGRNGNRAKSSSGAVSWWKPEPSSNVSRKSEIRESVITPPATATNRRRNEPIRRAWGSNCPAGSASTQSRHRQ